jgi:hypothetical protein
MPWSYHEMLAYLSVIVLVVIQECHLSRLVFLIAAAAVPALCQVQVHLKTNQNTYLVGEPIFVVVDVENIGTEPVGYSSSYGHADLTVPGGRKKPAPNLFGCFAGFGEGYGGGGFHPPLMKPGQTVSFWFLVKGYNLRAGDYTLHASGKAGVLWKNYPGARSNNAPPAAPKHSETDPVEGQMFEGSLKLIIEDSTEPQLRQRYASYVADAEGWDMERRARAREAIAEMAPPFLEKTLLGLASQPESARLAVEGLGQIPTRESRSDLVSLFDNSTDLRLRAFIVRKLAGIGSNREVSFFSSLLAGRSTAVDDEIRKFAALGLGRIGGKDALKSLESAPQSPNPDVRAAVATALGNTKDSGAVPVLIEMYSDQSGSVQSAVCSALITLTHYQWCDGSGAAEELQDRWRAWWRSHTSQLPLYDSDQCPAFGASLPMVK